MRLTKKSNPLKPKFPRIQLDKTGHIVDAYTDGGCRDNGHSKSVGAWAYVIVDRDDDTILHEDSQAAVSCTNNTMELQAVISCLFYIKHHIPNTSQVLLHMDSQYVLHGITTWRKKWIQKNWEGVKNPMYWQILSRLVDEIHNVQYKYVAAHQKNDKRDTIWNNYVDSMCSQNIKNKQYENTCIK